MFKLHTNNVAISIYNSGHRNLRNYNGNETSKNR